MNRYEDYDKDSEEDSDEDDDNEPSAREPLERKTSDEDHDEDYDKDSEEDSDEDDDNEPSAREPLDRKPSDRERYSKNHPPKNNPKEDNARFSLIVDIILVEFMLGEIPRKPLFSFHMKTIRELHASAVRNLHESNSEGARILSDMSESEKRKKLVHFIDEAIDIFDIISQALNRNVPNRTNKKRLLYLKCRIIKRIMPYINDFERNDLLEMDLTGEFTQNDGRLLRGSINNITNRFLSYRRAAEDFNKRNRC